jgi:hypothetical protein
VDTATGKLTLPLRPIPKDGIYARVGGGKDCTATFVGLEVAGQIVARHCGQGDETLRSVTLSAPAHVGQWGRVVIVDKATGPWGHILADNVVIWN